MDSRPDDERSVRPGDRSGDISKRVPYQHADFDFVTRKGHREMFCEENRPLHVLEVARKSVARGRSEESLWLGVC
jgi:hypothetical protein